MALKPHYMLRGHIRIVKDIKTLAMPKGYIERHYVDEHGDTAIIMMRELGNFEQDTGGRADVYEDDNGLLTI